jgi:hypothetical protein
MGLGPELFDSLEHSMLGRDEQCDSSKATACNSMYEDALEFHTQHLRLVISLVRQIKEH